MKKYFQASLKKIQQFGTLKQVTKKSIKNQMFFLPNQSALILKTNKPKKQNSSYLSRKFKYALYTKRFLKHYYNLSFTQYNNYLKKFFKTYNNLTFQMLLKKMPFWHLLHNRLNNLIYYATPYNFFTMQQIKQLLNHKLIKCNSQVITFSNYTVNKKLTISIFKLPLSFVLNVIHKKTYKNF